MLPTRDSLHCKGPTQTKSKVMEKYIPCKWKQKKNAIFISKKQISDQNCRKRQRTLLYTNKSSIYQEDITITYTPNIGELMYINIKRSEKRHRLQHSHSREFQYPTFNIRSSRQKINKEMLHLNYTLDQSSLTDIHRTFH